MHSHWGKVDAEFPIPEIVASHIKGLKSNKAAGGAGLSSSFLNEVEGQIVKPRA